MYRLMKSVKSKNTLSDSGAISLYRQIQIKRFYQFKNALAACKTANNMLGSRHYILDELGKEFYENTWID
jgi:hypothetical protein